MLDIWADPLYRGKQAWEESHKMTHVIRYTLLLTLAHAKRGPGGESHWVTLLWHLGLAMPLCTGKGWEGVGMFRASSFSSVGTHS